MRSLIVACTASDGVGASQYLREKQYLAERVNRRPVGSVRRMRVWTKVDRARCQRSVMARASEGERDESFVTLTLHASWHDL